MKLNKAAEHEAPQKILIYGQPKTGKSLLAATLLDEGYNLIWFDVESGYQTLIAHVDEKHWENLELIRVQDTRETPLAIETCTKVMSGKSYNICDEHGRIGCPFCLKDKKDFTQVCLGDKDSKWVVVFDSLSQISASAMVASTRDIGDFDRKEHKHYEKLGMYLNIFLGAVQQAPFHIVCISHADAHEDVDKKEKVFPVCGTRNFGKLVAKYFDHVVYTSIINKKFVAASSAAYNPRITAGSRSSLAMETGVVSLGDLLKCRKKEGGMDSDIQEAEDAEGNKVTVVKQNPLQAKMTFRK